MRVIYFNDNFRMIEDYDINFELKEVAVIFIYESIKNNYNVFSFGLYNTTKPINIIRPLVKLNKELINVEIEELKNEVKNNLTKGAVK